MLGDEKNRIYRSDEKMQCFRLRQAEVVASALLFVDAYPPRGH
jgi:hypothetical protein